MDFFSAMKVSASGMSVQRTRVNLATSNLANAETTRGPDGTPYKRRDPIIEPLSFEYDVATTGAEPGPIGVQVVRIVEDQTPGKKVFMPGHPDADDDGFVVLPNVNPIHEVVNLMSAQNGFDANATAMDTLKTMAQRAMEIIS
jgi:flagellar basal-body rod protein FlgC